MIEFNINDEVEVKLTDLGRKIRQEKYEGSLAAPKISDYEYAPKEEINGWSRWQLWSLMEIYGEYMWCESELPFETNIRILTKT